MADRGQRGRRPDRAGRVLRIAQDEERGPGAGEFLLEVGEVDGVLAVLVGQVAREDLASAVEDRVGEDVVHRRRDQDMVAGFGQRPHHRRQGGHHPGAEGDPLGVHREIVATRPPVGDGASELLGDDSVPQHPRREFASNGFEHGGGSREVHVGDPHGKLVGGDVPFEGIGPTPVDLAIEVRQHWAPRPSRWWSCRGRPWRGPGSARRSRRTGWSRPPD